MKPRGSKVGGMIASLYTAFIICDFAQTSTILFLHTTDVIKGQWINFQDNGSKDRKDTEKKVVILHHKEWHYCERLLLLSFIYSWFCRWYHGNCMCIGKTSSFYKLQGLSQILNFAFSFFFFFFLNINCFNEQQLVRWDILNFNKVNKFC